MCFSNHAATESMFVCFAVVFLHGFSDVKMFSREAGAAEHAINLRFTGKFIIFNNQPYFCGFINWLR